MSEYNIQPKKIFCQKNINNKKKTKNTDVELTTGEN